MYDVHHGKNTFSVQDTFDDLSGEFNQAPGADYRQPMTSGSLEIFGRPLTQSMRRVCYDQLTYQDTAEEGNEFFTLQLTRDPNTPSRTPFNVVIDEVFQTTLVTILDDDGELHLIGVCSKFAQVVHFMLKNESVHIIRAVCCCCYGKGVW